MVGIHSVSPLFDPSRLAGRKTSNIHLSILQWGTANAEIKTRPGGSIGLSKVPSFQTWSRKIALHNTLCLLSGPTNFYLPGSFYFIFSKTSPKHKDCEISVTVVNRLWFVMRWIVFRTDIAEMVDWELKTQPMPWLPILTLPWSTDRHCRGVSDPPSLRAELPISGGHRYPPPQHVLRHSGYHHRHLHHQPRLWVTIQYNTVQYSTVQYSTVQYNTICLLYNAMQCNTIQYNTMQGNAMQSENIDILWCNAMQYKLQYNTIQCNAMQCTCTCKHAAIFTHLLYICN